MADDIHLPRTWQMPVWALRHAFATYVAKACLGAQTGFCHVRVSKCTLSVDFEFLRGACQFLFYTQGLTTHSRIEVRSFRTSCTTLSTLYNSLRSLSLAQLWQITGKAQHPAETQGVVRPNTVPETEKTQHPAESKLDLCRSKLDLRKSKS